MHRLLLNQFTTCSGGLTCNNCLVWCSFGPECMILLFMVLLIYSCIKEVAHKDKVSEVVSWIKNRLQIVLVHAIIIVVFLVVWLLVQVCVAILCVIAHLHILLNRLTIGILLRIDGLLLLLVHFSTCICKKFLLPVFLLFVCEFVIVVVFSGASSVSAQLGSFHAGI